MKKYKITLWRNDDYCSKYGTPDECCFTKEVEADSAFWACHLAVDPHVDKRNFNNKPSVYEITEL